MKVSRLIRSSIYSSRISLRRISSPFRRLPEFLIIGAQKSGTTSLYSYLSMHPKIEPAFLKEVHYFDLNYHKSEMWYKAHFSLNSKLDRSAISGEASPQYMFHPHAIKRIAADIPDVKLIVVLRDPVFRAYSHYQHQVRVGREQLSFEDAVEQEPNRIKGELSKMLNNPSYNSFNYLMYSYLERGKYCEQINRCYSLFNKNQVFILQSEYLSDNIQYAYDELISFLGLPGFRLPVTKRYNTQNYNSIRPKTQLKLSSLFSPNNEQLFKLIGKRFDWT